MAPALNQIGPDMAARYVTSTSAKIERQNRRPRPRARALFVLHYKRAVFGRVCDRPLDVTREDLALAAQYGLAMLEARGEPRELPRDVLEMRQIAGLLAAFGDADQHVRLDGLPTERWYHPPKPELDASAQAYRLFNRFLLTRTVAHEDVVNLDDQLAAAELHPVHNQAIAPIVHCLEAIVHDDAHEFEVAWGTLTNAFATVAQHGEFARRMEGLLDPMALGLLALARRHGFTLTVTSPYAPADLLGAPTLGDPSPVGAA